MRLNIAIEDQISSNAFPNTREDDNLVECFQKLLIDKQQTQQSTQNLDYITISNLNYSKRIESKNVLHFAFVGDSRIRQIFHLFVEVILHNSLSIPWFLNPLCTKKTGPSGQ